jgi:4-amino-4-deoxy-L-arabinose transferase-like glycosyltransferase
LRRHDLPVLLFAFAGFFIFFNVWNGSLYPWDEGWYAEIAREIVADKSGWLTLHYNQEPFFQKPPLFIWLIAGAFKAFGVNEFSVRFWPALCGLGCVVLVCLLTEEMFSSRRSALLSSLTLLGFSRFYRQSRMGMIDVPLAFLVLLGTYLFWLGRKKPGFLFWIGPVTALAFLMKSFAALLLPLIVMVFACIAGEKKILLHPRFLLGMVVGIVICLPWHIYQYVTNGAPFMNEYFFSHIVKRTFETFPDQPEKKLFHYFTAVVFNDFPLGQINLITLPYFFFLMVKEKERAKQAPFLLTSTAIVAILLLFTLVRTKLPWYIVPVYPFLSIATAVSIDRSIHAQQRVNKQRLIALAFIVLTVIPAARIAFYEEQRTLDYRPDLKEIGLAAQQQSGRDDTVYFYDVKEETSALFYVGRKMVRVSQEQLLSAVSARTPFTCVLSKKDGFYERLKREEQGGTVVAENKTYLLVKR